MTDGRSGEFRSNYPMTVLGVPDVRVLKLVHVHVERAIRVHVHVGDEESVRWAIRATARRILSGLYRIRDLEVLQSTAPTGWLFVLKNATTLPPNVSDGIPGHALQQPSPETVAAGYFRIAGLLYKKIPWAQNKGSKGSKRKSKGQKNQASCGATTR